MKNSITTLRTIVGILFITCLIYSCSEEEEACQAANLGTLTFQNTNTEGTLIVFINEFGSISVNGPGDVSVPPEDSVTIDIPAGPQNLKARLRESTCVGSRCAIRTTTLPERDVELTACQTSTISY